jgi:hypothetical protein
VSARIHADWRSKIHDVLRAKRRKKITGDYIQQSLDYFEMLLPHLRIGSDVVLTRERISKITEGLWSESSITKFFQHLARTEVMDCQSAGANGLRIKLLKDLTESPWRNRRPEEAETDTPTGPMVEIPDDEDYSATVNLDLAIEAIDAVAGTLVGVEICYPPKEAKLEDAADRVARAIRNLAKIRTSLVSGDDAGLAEVVNEVPPRHRTFYRRPEQA